MLRVPGPAPRGVVPKQQHGGARPRVSACGGGSARPCGRCGGAREEPGEAAPAAPVRVYPCQDGDKWSCQPARRELPEASGSAHPAGPAAAAAPPRRARPALNFPGPQRVKVGKERSSWRGHGAGSAARRSGVAVWVWPPGCSFGGAAVADTPPSLAPRSAKKY